MAVSQQSTLQEDAWMNFYTRQHKHYCGIDLHAKAMYVCIRDQAGTILVHKNLPTTPEAFLRIIAPYREDVVVGVECMFTWYWVADLCQKEGIAFVLGHALYMKAIHGGKAKNDKIDAHKIAVLLRGGMMPQAYVYPSEMRATRDLLRRRCHLARKRAELLAHIHNTNSQYNLPEIGKRLANKANREGVADHFPDPSVHKAIEVDVSLIDHYDQLLGEVELYLTRSAKAHDVQTFARRNPMANGWGRPAKRLATSTYAGPLPKPRSSLSGRVSPGKSILRNSNINMAKPKRSRYSGTSWVAPCITCSRGNKRLT
jgi:hypothetical protein